MNGLKSFHLGIIRGFYVLLDSFANIRWYGGDNLIITFKIHALNSVVVIGMYQTVYN